MPRLKIGERNQGGQHGQDNKRHSTALLLQLGNRKDFRIYVCPICWHCLLSPLKGFYDLPF